MRFKCYYCKELIEEQDLFLVPKKDRKKNIKLLPDGSVDTYNAHKSCADYRNNAINGLDDLNNYVVDKYFHDGVPTTFFITLKEMREHTDYKKILGCLKHLEENLKKGMSDKTFVSSSQKGSYILAAVKNNISVYMENKRKAELNRIDEYNRLNNTVQFIDRSKIKTVQTEVIDYEFLD